MDPSRKAFNPGEALVPGLVFIFGMAYLLQTAGASPLAMRWPYMIAAITAVLWLAVVAFYVFAKREESQAAPFTFRGLAMPALMVVAPVIYLLAMPYLGFALSTMIFLPVLFRLLGSRSWRSNLAIALVLTFVLQIVLIQLMRMSLPRLEIGSLIL